MPEIIQRRGIYLGVGYVVYRSQGCVWNYRVGQANCVLGLDSMESALAAAVQAIEEQMAGV